MLVSNIQYSVRLHYALPDTRRGFLITNNSRTISGCHWHKVSVLPTSMVKHSGLNDACRSTHCQQLLKSYYRSIFVQRISLTRSKVHSFMTLLVSCAISGTNTSTLNDSALDYAYCVIVPSLTLLKSKAANHNSVLQFFSNGSKNWLEFGTYEPGF